MTRAQRIGKLARHLNDAFPKYNFRKERKGDNLTLKHYTSFTREELLTIVLKISPILKAHNFTLTYKKAQHRHLGTRVGSRYDYYYKYIFYLKNDFPFGRDINMLMRKERKERKEDNNESE